MSECRTCIPAPCDALVDDDERLYSLDRILFPFVLNCPAGFDCSRAQRVSITCCGNDYTVSLPSSLSASGRLRAITQMINKCALANAACPTPVPTGNPGVPENPGVPPIPPTTSILYYNQPQYASVNCGDGGVYTYSVPAGSYLSTSLKTSNAQAKQDAIDTANLVGFCLPYAPSLCLNTAITSSLVLSGGNGPFSWNIESGTVPDGMTLTFTSSNYATLSGTPTTLGTYTFTLTVNDSVGGQLVKTVTVEVIGFTLTVTSTGSTGSDGTATATPSVAGTYSYLWGNGEATQTITGLAPGTYDVTVTDDDTGCEATGSVAVESTLEASYASTDCTVVDGVSQFDGTVTVTVSGGVGPYTVFNYDGYGNQSGPGPDFVYTNLPGGVDYSFEVMDSEGTLTGIAVVHVYTEAFSWHYDVSGAKGTTAYPAGDVSTGPTTPISKFDPSATGSLSATLDSVVFSLDSASLKTNYGVTNNIAPASCHFNLTTSTAYTLTVESVVRISGTISRPTTSGNTSLPSLGVVGPAATSVGPFTNTASDGTTLAACTGPGTLNLLYTSVHPVIDQTGSSGCTCNVTSPTYTFQSTVTYNYSVPRE